MHSKLAGTLAGFGLAIAVASTADAHAQTTEELLENRPEAPVTVHVNNGNWLDVRIYAVRNGNVYDRIGTVRSFSTRKFELGRAGR